LTIEWVELKKIKPNPKNPNQHNPDQIDRMVKLISHYGWRHPIIVSNQSGHIVVGHCRYEAAKKLNLPKIPVHYQDFTPEDEYGFMVADNGSADWSNLNYGMINAEISELGPDWDLEWLGLQDFVLDMSDKINQGDENAEWVGMPDFVAGDKEIKLTLVFRTELEREQYAKKHKIAVTSKHSNQWLARL
jgi:hypothetical protein